MAKRNRIGQGKRRRVYRAHGNVCHYCKVPLEKGDGGRAGPATRTIDHKVPAAMGGTDDFDNLVPSCVRCNIAKGSRPYEDFMTDVNVRRCVMFLNGQIRRSFVIAGLGAVRGR